MVREQQQVQACDGGICCEAVGLVVRPQTRQPHYITSKVKKLEQGTRDLLPPLCFNYDAVKKYPNLTASEHVQMHILASW